MMKNTAMFWVAATTLVLISLTIMAAMDFPFNWVFYITVLGQIMLVYMVFRVLTDNYTTDKTFKDFYEDFPVKPEIN
jgi:TRAP-type C4-dicarboxylate transport system permease small subunit